MGQRNRWVLIVELKQSLAIVKQLSRLAQGQCFLAMLNVLVYNTTQFTHTYIHRHMRIHPPDLAALFPCSGKWGISFLAMCCFLASERLCSFFLQGAVMGKSLHHSNPTCLLLNVSFSPFSLLPLPFFLYVFVCLCLALSSSLHLLPSQS